MGVSFLISISEMFDSHYFVCSRILFWCTAIVVSGGWGVGRKSGFGVHGFLYLQLLSKSSSLTVPSATLEMKKILAVNEMVACEMLCILFDRNKMTHYF